MISSEGEQGSVVIIYPDIGIYIPSTVMNDTYNWYIIPINNHWIGLRENLHRKPMGFYHQIDRAFRLKFSHHPFL